MSTNTTNYNLVKPDETDFYDIDVQNGNMDIIDLAMKALDDHKVGGDTIYGGTVVTDLDSITKGGFYTCLDTATGVPYTGTSWFVLHQNSNIDTTAASQIAIAYSLTSISIMYRVKSTGTWSAWTSTPNVIGIKEYSPTSTYIVGDYVSYKGVLYRNITAITVGEVWTASKWFAVAGLQGEVKSLKTRASSIALDFSATTAYSYGDRAIYNDVLYKYTNTTTTTGVWNASYWTAEPVGTGLKNIQKTALTVTTPYQYTGDIHTLGAGVYSVNRTAGNVPIAYEDGILTVKAYGTAHKELSYFVPYTNEVYTKSYHVTFGWSTWNCASSPLRGVKQVQYQINNVSYAAGQVYMIPSLAAALAAAGGVGSVVGADVRITGSNNSGYIKGFFRFDNGLVIELSNADTISADVNIFYV